MASTRQHKLADQIKVITAEMLERRIKDPRLGFVTVTDVRLTGDNREATVFYTVYGTPEEVAGLDTPTAPYLRWIGVGLRAAHGYGAAQTARYRVDVPGVAGAWTEDAIAAAVDSVDVEP